MQQFDIPIAIFFFKRIEKTQLIIKRLAVLKPKKLYLLGDGPRDSNEAVSVDECRRLVEDKINWDCEIIRRYAQTNIGVYENIAGGVKWVFEREENAIFLEDDNLPEISFFQFCKEMLLYYKEDNRILWICGTNYLLDYQPQDDSSYVFTHNMMPCGWASWGNKFMKYYDGELKLWNDPYINKRVRAMKYDSNLHNQDINCWERESYRIKNNQKPGSWDYQMSFTIRAHGLYGIIPKYNQITNIGVDMDSIHGGTSFKNVMTRRFCGLPTKEMNFPLKHPKIVKTDVVFEKRIAKIITYPLSIRIKCHIIWFIKKVLFINQQENLLSSIKRKVGL